MNDALGHVTHHMALHIAAMNIVAPVAAWLLRDARFARLDRLSAGLGAAAALQLGLLWLLHVPAVFSLMGTSPLLAAPMHAALLGLSFVFWRQVFAVATTSPWKSIVALLLTGKIVCLLGVLLLFANRPVYTLSHGDMVMPSSVADQQLAGLLMLVGCPLTYIAGAVLLVSRWLLGMDRNEPAPGSGTAA